MTRALLILLVLLLPSCAGQRPKATAAAPPSVCRLAPDGGSVADRGIGGTGGPALADRGIGGTGIIGVITGFGSVCLDGLEVGMQNAPLVTIDGQPSDAGSLRGGQFAAIEAGPDLRARSVAIRHEVSGPVETIEQAGTVLQVAGQRVLVLDTTLGTPGVQHGDWVAVSGLRIPGGAIEATRIDRRLPGLVIVHGTATAAGQGAAIGGLALSGAPKTTLGAVRVTGYYEAGSLRPVTVEPDSLGTDPATLFPRTIDHLVMESYASLAGHQLRLGHMEAAAPEGLTGFSTGPSRAVFDLRRQGNGSYTVMGTRDGGVGGYSSFGPTDSSGDRRMFEPAPTARPGPDLIRRPGFTPGGPRGYGPGGVAAPQNFQGEFPTSPPGGQPPGRTGP
jgi:hypothetical protein